MERVLGSYGLELQRCPLPEQTAIGIEYARHAVDGACLSALLLPTACRSRSQEGPRGFRLPTRKVDARTARETS
eukprot:7493898-Pyramimonas_sp.AAC.1